MQNVVIKTLDHEALKINEAKVLIFDDKFSELRCMTNRDQIITFDLHQISEIGFVVSMANDLNLVVHSSKVMKEEEEK